MNPEIAQYNQKLVPDDREICELLAAEIDTHLPAADSKIWHAHPVWFLEGNPIVGYSNQKRGIRLMFWSGADFREPGLEKRVGQKFKDASIFYKSFNQIKKTALRRWLRESQSLQWDSKNIAKRKGKLVRLK
jgi:hypothetical protein